MPKNRYTLSIQCTTERNDTMAKAKYKRQSNGYFQTRVWDGTYLDTGKKKYIIIRSKKSSKDLEDKVRLHNLKIENREYTRNTNTTFHQYAKEWMTLYKSARALNTKKMYDNVINKHLIKISCNLREINRTHYVLLLNDTDGDRTKQQIDMTMKQIIKSAIKDKLLPASIYDEIFDDSVAVSYKPEEKRPLREYEKKAIKAADFEPMEKAFVYILYGCGLRRGEAIALTRFDVSLDRKEITINKAIAFDKNTPILKDTKNEVHRTVPIPDSTFPIIQAYVKSLNGTYLFPMKKYESYITKSSLDKMWKRIIKKMQAVSEEEIIGLTPHIFRHNYCSSLCYKIPEISIEKIASLLGDSVKMVIEVYNHVIAEKEKPEETVSKAMNL